MFFFLRASNLEAAGVGKLREFQLPVFVDVPHLVVGQKENPWVFHRFWSIFRFTNRFFRVAGIFDP